MIRTMTAFLMAAALVLTAAQQPPTEQLTGRVLDSVSGDPIPMATVAIPGTQRGVAADYEGRFALTIQPDDHMIRVSAIGYTARTVHIHRPLEPVTIQLVASVFSFEEIVVSNQRARTDDPSVSHHVQNSTEDLMARVPGAGFLQRGNFAWEPVIRGMGGGQIGVVIDGIQVIGACVDKMDPTSAYVEVENLARLELTKGGFDLAGGSQIGGSVNLVTEKPRFDEKAWASSEVAFESASAMRRGRLVGGVSKGMLGLRASWSYRKANDFRPGGGNAIAGSGYEKNNYKIDATLRPHHAHEITASYLADNAWNVGYPVLLMDATLAQARIYSLNHIWTPHDAVRGLTVDTRVYRTTVDHWMDDFSRDVMDRPVMRGMYMPMYGFTRTTGGLSKAHYEEGRNRFGLTIDAYRTRSFGDMWMFSVFEGIQDMYLLNLDHIVVDTGSLAADASRQLTSRLRVHGSTRLNVTTRSRGEDDRSYVMGNASASVEHAFNPLTKVRLGVATVGRAPTHVENFGHYVYNYVDGYFYTGNPDLKPERSWQMDLGFERWTDRYAVKAGLFVNLIEDYIVGMADDGFGSSDIYQFRVYDNASRARLAGFELSGTLGLGRGWSVASSAAYVHGQNLEVGEPLYFMPPFSGLVGLRWDGARTWLEAETRFAMPQNRVARVVANEEGTDGWATLNLRFSRTLGTSTHLKGGVENVFDARYHEHLSFGNLPAEGRNLFLSVGYDI